MANLAAGSRSPTLSSMPLARPSAISERERLTPSAIGRTSAASERSTPQPNASTSVALIARVVATTNRPAQELFAVRPTVTLYRIHVRQFANGTRSWCVLRRYSEFVDLAIALSRTVGTLPTLPPKLVINTPEALADRYLELDGFLRSLLSMPLAAGHARLRSFLGADAAWAPVAGAVDPAGIVEDDWEHEAEAGAGGDVAPLPIAGAGAPGSDPVEVEPVWLLSGSWAADEARCRDGIEPLLRAMGTPQAVRRMLRGDRVVSRITHSPGVKLVEVTISALGEGKPATYEVDGKLRPMWMGTREAAVRAVELRRTGAVRVEYTLPDAKGSIYDTRRVINGGEEMERIIELHMAHEPPLRLHRLMVRTGQQPPPTLRPAGPLHSDGASEADSAGVDSSGRLPDLLLPRAPQLNGSGSARGGGHHPNSVSANGALGSSSSGAVADGISSMSRSGRPLARALSAVCMAPGRWTLALVEHAAAAPASAVVLTAWLLMHAHWLLLWLRAGTVSGEDAPAAAGQLTLMLYWRLETDVEAATPGAVVWIARALHVLLAVDAVALCVFVRAPVAARVNTSGKATHFGEIASVPTCGVASVALVPEASSPQAELRYQSK